MRALLLIAFVAACNDPLKEAQRIEELRVLGAQVRVDDDPTQATPSASDSVTIEWLVADPGGQPLAMSWTARACSVDPTAEAPAPCLGAPLGEVDSQSHPQLGVTVPDLARRLEIDASFHEAEDGVTAVFRVDVGGEPNANPNLDAAILTLDGQAWSETSCVAADGALHSLSIALPETARESGETLQISHAATAGRLDRRFSAIDPATSLAIELPWEAPAGVEGLTTVTFYTVVRDGRGGTAWLVHSACIVP